MAQSDMSKAISGLSGVKVTDGDIYANTVAHMSNPYDLGNYQVGQDFYDFGKELASNPDVYNGYLGSLVKQFGVIFQKVALAQNPLSMFKKGVMPFGSNIETIVYDTLEQKEFDPNFKDSHGNSQSPFAQNYGRVLNDNISITQDITTPITILDTIDTQYFQNLTQFHNFIWGKITANVNGAINGEYHDTMMALSGPASANRMPVFNIKDDADATKKLAKKIKTMAKKMRYFNRDLNGDNVNQSTLVKDIVVMVNVDRSVDLDMDYFGQLFNPENSRDFNVQYVEVDRFPDIWRYSKDHVVTADDAKKGYVDVRQNGNDYGKYYIGDTIKAGTLAKANATDAVQVFDGSKLAAVVLDRDALQVWDQLPMTLSTIANPRGRYNNVFLNKKTQFVFVPGLNAAGIYIDNGHNEGKISFSDPTASADKGK